VSQLATNPASADAPFPWPLLGLNEGLAAGDQPPLTSPDCMNVQAIDLASGRVRGGRRPALTKFNTHQLSGANAVTALLSTVKYDARQTYTLRTPPTVLWQKALASNLDALAIVTDRGGNVYVAAATSGGGTGVNYLAKYSPGGTLVWLIPVPTARNTDVIKSVRLDGMGGIFAVVSGSAAGPTSIFKFLETEGGAVVAEWSVQAENSGWFSDVAVGADYMYAVELTPAAGVYLYRYDGTSTATPTRSWVAQIRAAAGYECYSIALASDGSCLCAMVDPTNPPAANGRIEKFGPQVPTGGPPVTPVWSYSGQGVGQAVVTTPDLPGVIFSQGYGTGGGAVYVTKLLDNGNSIATLTWSVATAALTTVKVAASLAVDKQGKVYQAIYNAGSGTVLAVVTAAGALGTTVTSASLSVATVEGFSVAVDPIQADASGTPQAESLYLGTSAGTAGVALHKLSLVSVTQADGSPRSPVYLGVCNGSLISFTKGAGAVTSIGSGIDTTGRWVKMAAALNRVLIVDGIQPKTYDVVAGTLANWTPTSGEVWPRRPRLLCIWNGRAMVSGSEGDPHNWGGSAVADFDNYDLFPAVQTATQAIAGNVSAAGLCPDIITALIPWSDDLLILGGDHSIWRITGDPAAGGAMHRVTDVTGIAWDAWCKDEAGTIYFFGNTGGLYRMFAGGVPQRLDTGSIRKRLNNVDVNANKIQLIWDDRDKCVHVVITCYTNTTQTTHYRWFRDRGQTGEMQPHQFGYVSGSAYLHNPLAVTVADADDPADRSILIGGQDGYVRYWDEAGLTDDGTDVAAYVVIGPLMAGGLGAEFKVNNWRGVLGAGSSDVTLSVYAAEGPEWSQAGAALFTATLSAGRNDGIWERVRGNAVFAKLSRTGSGLWSLESLVAAVLPGGRVRNR
jgi:hypothetical protein